MMGGSSVLIQYLATICVNINALSYGVGCGWPSPSFPILSSNETSIAAGPLTSIELSWVGAIMCLGGLTGTIFFGWVADIVGRKKSLLFAAFPGIFCWLLIIFGTNVYYFLLARFLIGFSGAGSFILIPLYIGEISEDRVRGTLSSQLVFFCNIGILLAFTLGTYFSIQTTAIVYLFIPVAYFIGVCCLPETPVYLMKTNREAEASQSLAFYRNARSNSLQMADIFKAELEKLRSQSNENGKENKSDLNISVKDFTSPVAIRALLIGFGLMTLNQMCGLFAMLNYTATIFAEAGSSLSPNMSAIIIGIIQLLGSCVSTYLCDKAGRKLLLSISSAGSCIGLVCLGTYTYFSILGFDVSDYTWVPILSFSFVIFIASWGVLTLPFVVIGEIMPEKIRARAASICMIYLWCLAFIAVKYFYQLSEVLGMHGSMFLFAGVCCVGAIFVLVCVPETKGKSFEEIQKLLVR